ncbi:hypothetical protein JCM11251_000912 [Rhodosporidiobolus azoricus]
MDIESQTLVLGEELEKLVTDSPATFPRLIDSLSETGTNTRSPSATAALTATIRNVVGCHQQDRHRHWIFHCDQKYFPIDLYHPHLNDATFAYKFALKASRSLHLPYTSFFPVEEDWYMKLHHHAVVFLAIRYRNHEHLLKHSEHSKQLDDFMLASADGLVEILQETARRNKGLAYALEDGLSTLTTGTKVQIKLTTLRWTIRVV